jgi:hypothetical protein
MKYAIAVVAMIITSQAASTRAGTTLKCDYMTDLGEDCGQIGGPGGFDPDPGQIGSGLHLWAWPSCENAILTMPCGSGSQGWWEVAAPGGVITILDDRCCTSSKERWHYMIFDLNGNPLGTGYDCFDPAQCT